MSIMMPCPLRILVAESDARLRALVSESLRDDGHTVVEICDGGRLLVEVSRRLQVEHATGLDVFVCSLDMPVMNGLAFVAALRASHLWTPVILTGSMSGDPSLAARAARLAATLVPSPFSLRRLRDEVHAAVRPLSINTAS